MAKLRHVKQHFGVIFHSAITTYLAVSRAFSSLDVRFIDIGETLDLCDIAVFNTVKSYISNVAHLNDSMIAIVCGGPLQINDIEDIVPLDYTKSLSYSFEAKPLDIDSIKTARKANTRVEIKTKKMDHLLLVIDNVVTEGLLLTEYNRVTSILNMTSRNNLRAAFINLITDKNFSFKSEDIVPISSEEFNKRLSGLRKKIKSTQGQILFKAIRESLKQGANIKAIVRNHKVDEFELQFFRKMVMSQRKLTDPFQPANQTSTVSSKIPSTVVNKGFMKVSRKHLKEKQH